jgi:putative membrane protein
MFHNWFMDGVGFGWFFWVAVIALIVWAIVNQNRRQNYPPQQHETALDILKKRYARGEINKDEFEEKKKDLS